MTNQNAQTEPWADVESRGKGLEMAYGADTCHNSDRISRLPGTINYPDAGKLKKGRKAALAKLISACFGNVYPLSTFKPNGGYVPPAMKHNLPAPVPAGPVSSLDELDKYNVPERIKRIIQQGNHPDEQKAENKDTSDSGWLFDALCGLARGNVPDEIILSIILDKRFGISAHILKQGRRAEKYAIRQVQRARLRVEQDRQLGWYPCNEKTNQPFASYHNARVAVLRLGLKCEYDAFRHRLKVSGQQLQEYQGDFTDAVISAIRQLILNEHGFDPKKEHVQDAVRQLGYENAYDPVCDYLDRLEWDGVPRINGFFSCYLGAEDNDLNCTVSRIVLMAAVRRAREPGCKFDLVVVLEGNQGSGKSTAIRIMAGDENFSDQEVLALDAKEQMEAIEGVWLYEIPELTGLGKADRNRIKAFISRTNDRARPAYARSREDRPRCCIFIGTTNEKEYLRDATGNRRFLPVKTGVIDLEALKRDRDQLWAEAAHAEAQGESITLPRELWEAAAQVQESRLEYDPWIDILSGIEGDKIPSDDIRALLGIPLERWNNAQTTRIGNIMRKLGWDGPKTIFFTDDSKKSQRKKGYKHPIPKQGDLLDA